MNYTRIKTLSRYSFHNSPDLVTFRRHSLNILTRISVTAIRFPKINQTESIANGVMIGLPHNFVVYFHYDWCLLEWIENLLHQLFY